MWTKFCNFFFERNSNLYAQFMRKRSLKLNKNVTFVTTLLNSFMSYSY
jgi:hypothetical protein